MSKYANFDLYEFIESDTAKVRGINNIPDFEEVEHLDELVRTILQPLRDAWGKPLNISSGYRCKALNDAVYGVPTSAHLRGYAADVQPVGDFEEFVKFAEGWLRDNNIAFDQSIREQKGRTKWWHIALYNSYGQQRRQFKAINL